MSDVAEVNDRTWENAVEKGAGTAVVMFYSPQCSHCQAMMAPFEAYAREFLEKAAFFRINVLGNPYTATRYGVVSTPTFKFFCKGRPVQELVGAVYPIILKKAVDEVLEYGPTCIEKSSRIDFDMAYV